MKAIYFQLLCGASGDMILSSMLDLGVPVAFLQSGLAKLGIESLQIEVERVKRAGISCSHVCITCGGQNTYRHYPGIIEMIAKGGYPRQVLENCRRILIRLAEAEAQVHGIAMDHVHFHEIGAIDTIVDVLGAGLCLEYLGAEKVFFSPLTIGHGTIDAAHGIMPVPAPATARLVEGLLVNTLDIPTEILTPTGAAILTALGEQCARMPSGRVVSVGYGCGDKVFEHYPNALRTLLLDLCEAPGSVQTDRVCVMESDMDHVSGEVLGFASEEVLGAGALDVSWTPIFMKKGRPGYRVTVLCAEQDAGRIADCLIAQTRTLGVRFRMADRIVASRRQGAGQLDGVPVSVKHCTHKDVSFAKPEYESLARIARERKIPLIDLMEQYGRRDGA